MIVQDMQNPGELSLHQSVRRMYMIASFMQTDARKIVLITISLNKQLPADVARMFRDAGQSVGEFMGNSVNSLFSSDIDKAHNSIWMKMEMEMNKALHAINEKLVTRDLRDALDLRIVSDSIDRIGEYGAKIENIAKIAINSTISKSV